MEGEEIKFLCKALVHFADQGCIHEEVFWHHIGLVGLPASTDGLGQKNAMNCLPKRGTIPETAGFCDLAHVEQCTEAQKLNEWVEESFQRMKERMGEATNTRPQVLVLKEPDKEMQK